jgi:hypothetical protein
LFCLKPLLEHLAAWREEKSMPFVSIFEQVILEKEQQLNEQKQLLDQQHRLLNQLQQQTVETWWQGIGVCLRLKFPTTAPALFAQVQKQTDLDWLRRFLASIESANLVEELRQLLP